jgi:hypothetical protein
MTDDNHGPTTEAAVPLSLDRPYGAGSDNRGPVVSCGRTHGPALLDLEDVAEHLRAMGVRYRLGEDGLWAGKVCLDVYGEVSTDGKVRGLNATNLGRGVQDFVELLQRIGAIPKEPPKPAARKGSGKRGCLSPFGRPVSRRLKGTRASEAVDRMCAFLDEHELSYEQLSPGRFLICRRIYYNPPSGRIRLKGSRTHPVKGFDALTKLLAEEANNPKLGHLYPPSLRQDELGVLVTDDPLERAWAGSMAARALAMAARSRPARGAVAQEG